MVEISFIPWNIPLEIVLPLALVLVILIIVMWVLYYKNRQLTEILISEKKRFTQYKRGVENLKHSALKNPNENFTLLNKFVRAFFKEYFQLDFSLTFLELEEHFKKEGNAQYASFCRLMSDKKYSGEKSKEEVLRLVDLFYNLLLNYESKN